MFKFNKFLILFFIILSILIIPSIIYAETPLKRTPELIAEFTAEFNRRSRTLVPYPTGLCPLDRNDPSGCYAPDSVAKAINMPGLKTPSDLKKLGFCVKDPSIPCNYTICDGIQIFINITRLLMGLIGGIVLLFFMYAALLFVTAQGSSEQITKARKVMRSSVTGLIIVMVSYQLVGYTLMLLLNKDLLTSTGPGDIKIGNITSPWDSLTTLKNNCR